VYGVIIGDLKGNAGKPNISDSYMNTSVQEGYCPLPESIAVVKAALFL
jgi:hypothetical protein